MIAEMRPQTQEEYNETRRREKLYNYYGIPYGIFDEKEVPKHIERDWSKAVSLIIKNEDIPKDLERRLMKYKNKNEGKNKIK